MSVTGLNEQVKEHAVRSGDWRHNLKAKQAYALFDKLNEVVFASALAQAVIGWDDSGRLKSRWGEYHFEGDGVSLFHHIDLRKDTEGLDLVVALLHVIRPSIVTLTIGLIAACFGIVLYNIGLSGVAIGLLILGFARPAPETA